MNCVATVRAAFFVRSFGYAFFIQRGICMKKSIGIIVIMVLLMISLFCVPASASTDGDFTYTVYAPGEVTITSYNKYGAKNVVIPATIEGYPVVKIGTAAFARTEITSVILPDSITSIGNEAFESCKQLETVAMPKKLKTIGWQAFNGCSKIAKISIQTTPDNPIIVP